MTSRAEINATLRRTNIRGKDYIDVSQRVDAFWQQIVFGFLLILAMCMSFSENSKALVVK